MMADRAIAVESLGKRYRIGENAPYSTLRDAIASAVFGPLRQRGKWFRRNGRPAENAQWIWALKDLSLEIQRGEVVGIIGCNGAGKSTFLKILSQITEPTEGTVDIYGRVGSLLEVGTGFHPELTGRENVFLNGSILGMRKTEIDRKFDEIVAFAEVDRFIDTPVKHYSSGMSVRLAFAVAAHLEPEILILDEVLAVGDILFQKKCLGKMDQVSKEGRTVLFVSHNMMAIQSLCRRAILLDQGRIAGDGDPREIVSRYLGGAATAPKDCQWDDIDAAPGNEQVRLHRLGIRPRAGISGEPLTTQTPLVVEIEYWNLQPGAHLNLTVYVYNQEGAMVFATSPHREPRWHGKPFPVGRFKSSFHIPADLLNDGVHRIELLVVKNQRSIIFRLPDALVFDVKDAEIGARGWYGRWPGACRPALVWSTELVAEESSPHPTRVGVAK